MKDEQTERFREVLANIRFIPEGETDEEREVIRALGVYVTVLARTRYRGLGYWLGCRLGYPYALGLRQLLGEAKIEARNVFRRSEAHTRIARSEINAYPERIRRKGRLCELVNGVAV